MHLRTLFALAVMALASSASAGTLSKVRSSTKSSPSHSSHSSSSSSGYHNSLSGLSNDDADLLMNAFWETVRFPFILPREALESHGPLPFVYEGHPYAHHGKGIVRIEPYVEPPVPTMDANAWRTVSATVVDENHWMPGDIVEPPPPPVLEDAPPEQNGLPVYTTDDPTVENPYSYNVPQNPLTDWDKGGHLWAVQVSADASIIDANTYRFRPRIRLFTPTRVELDAESGIYRERLDAQDQALEGRKHDWLTVSAAHLSYRFAQSQAVSFRVGAGGRMLADREDVKVGPDFFYGIEAFPHKPLVLSLQAGCGTLGKAFVVDLRASIGVVVGALEIMLGAERLSFGDTVLSGPVGGIRLWF